MTQVICEPRTTRTAPMTRADVERLLRDLAFALRMGRQAAREIRGEQALAGRPVEAAAATGREVCAAV